MNKNIMMACMWILMWFIKETIKVIILSFIANFFYCLVTSIFLHSIRKSTEHLSAMEKHLLENLSSHIINKNLVQLSELLLYSIYAAKYDIFSQSSGYYGMFIPDDIRRFVQDKKIVCFSYKIIANYVFCAEIIAH